VAIEKKKESTDTIVFAGEEEGESKSTALFDSAALEKYGLTGCHFSSNFKFNCKFDYSLLKQLFSFGV